MVFFEELHGLVFCGGQNGLIFFGVQSPVIAALNNRQPLDFCYVGGSALDKVCAPCRRKIRKFFKKVHLL